MNYVFPKSKIIELRELKKSDFEDIHIYSKNKEVVKYLTWGPNLESDTQDFISIAMKERRHKNRISFDLAIIEKKSKNFIGTCGIYIKDEKNRSAEIGYCLNKSYWSKGFGSEVVKILSEFGFNKLKLHRISAHCDPDNIASIKVLEKNGFQLEGYKRENFITIQGNWRDSLFYSLIEHEWEQYKLLKEFNSNQ